MAALSPKDQKLAQKAPHVFQLVQKLDPLLASVGLTGHVARAGASYDISGSMQRMYQNGQVQELANRSGALAHRFDDNGALDVFRFNTRAEHVGEVQTCDLPGYVASAFQRIDGGTSYVAAMKAIREFYFGSFGPRNKPYRDGNPPVYMMFYTDGAPRDDRKSDIIDQIRWSSYEPIFWQFIALGADYYPGQTATVQKSTGGFWSRKTENVQVAAVCPQEFEFLGSLDTLTGRYVDNASFFAIWDAMSIEPEELFRRMMIEYPSWLQQELVRTTLL